MTSIFEKVDGGKAIIDWFGCVPRFHDAEVLQIVLRSDASSTLRIHAWNITEDIDTEGYFKTDAHAVVTIVLDGVSCVELSEFHLPGIILDMKFAQVENFWEIAWSSSYGIEGKVRAVRVRFDLEPGKP